VSTGDQVIINPSDALEDGQQVTVAEAPQGQSEDRTGQHPGAVASDPKNGSAR